MPPEPWKTLTSREVYRNKWMRLREDLAAMPNGRTTIYGVAELGRPVGILPFVTPDEVVMVRQYRYVQQENQRWEMPTGGSFPGEDLEAAAQRELMEEIGYRAGRLEWISTFYSSKSVCDETAYLYLGTDLTPVQCVPDETEFLEVAVLPFAEVVRQVCASEIRDAMTVIAVLHTARRRGM